MDRQGVLPVRYEADEKGITTSLAGILPYLDLAVASKLVASIRRHMGLREGGWDDVSMVLTIVLLNCAGGTRVADVEQLERDPGLRHLMRRMQLSCLCRRERRELERQWKKAEARGEKVRAFPSPSSVFRYLDRFHDAKAETAAREAVKRAGRKAVIVPETEALRGLWRVVQDQLAFLYARIGGETIATLDLDATLVETFKADALFCYKHFRAYQPLNVFWKELGVMVYSQFRDGNVPAGYAITEVLVRALDMLPKALTTVQIRSDTAGYDWDFLRYCAEGKHPRFGRIDFAVGADVTEELRKEVARLAATAWAPLVRRLADQDILTEQEWAEVEFVPNAAAHTKKGPTYRFVVTREELGAQQTLPDVQDERPQVSLPFPTMEMTAKDGTARRYKVYALVTTLEGPGDQIIWWLRERCGRSEEVHAVMKNDLAGGTLPSKRFGANAAWWALMIVSLNLNVTMQRLVLRGTWVHRRMKTIRFHITHIAGRFVYHARQLILRVNPHAYEELRRMRARIIELAAEPAG